MIELEVSAAAAGDLDDIARFSLATFGAERTSRYLEGIEQTMKRLQTFPESGTIYPHVVPPIRYTNVGSHRIFYTRTGDMLRMVRILHHAMRPHRRLKS